MYIMFYVFIILIGLGVYSSKRKHLLAALLSLEFIVIGVFMSFFLSFSVSTYFYSLIYLTFTACEGALGLAILVSMSRSHGGDYYSSFNMNY